jgi:hypothetical protein
MRPVEVAGVDVIDSEPNDFAQDCDRAIVIFWWPEYMWTGELHRAVAHASQDQIVGKLECTAGQVLVEAIVLKLESMNYQSGRTKMLLVPAACSRFSGGTRIHFILRSELRSDSQADSARYTAALTLPYVRDRTLIRFLNAFSSANEDKVSENA